VSLTDHVLVQENDPHYGKMNLAFAQALQDIHNHDITPSQELAIWHEICVSGRYGANICPAGLTEKLTDLIDSPGLSYPAQEGKLLDAGAVFLVGPAFNSTGGSGELLPVDGTMADPTTGRRTLFHYTKEDRMNKIVESQELWPSTKANNPSDARYGDGQYLSDIPPGTKSNPSLGRAFYGVPWRGKSVTHYVEIDVTDLDVYQAPDRPDVFLIRNTNSLDLTNRIVSFGANEGEGGGGGGE
jgi:hypothetical protein